MFSLWKLCLLKTNLIIPIQNQYLKTHDEAITLLLKGVAYVLDSVYAFLFHFHQFRTTGQWCKRGLPEGSVE